MRQTHRILSLIFFLHWIPALILSGCSTATEKLSQKKKIGVPVSRVFYAKYEEVEAALKQAMIKYPQRVDNSEAGILETDYVKGEARFRPPQMTNEFSSGYRYRILIRMVRGVDDGRSAVRVLVLKQAELVRDFFAEPEAVASDGLEEDVILYRLARELTISQAIQRNTEKENKKAQERSKQ